jgi:hypothetical protein
MVDRKWAMKKVKKNGIGADPSTAVPQWCGQCATAIAKNEFCPACQDLFRGLGGRNVLLATVVRRTQRHWSGLTGK